MSKQILQAEAAPSAQAEHGESTLSVIAAIAANIAIGIFKFIAAGLSGSSALITEGVHSIVDSGNGLLLLLGMRRAKRPADAEHPFGYGMELYFWTLIVAVMIFALGGGVSLYEGYTHIMEIKPGDVPGDPFWSYVVCIGCMVMEGMSLTVALKQFNAARGSTPPLEFIATAKDPTLYTVVLEDSAAELGLIFALGGITLTQWTGNLYYDACASLLIGLLLVGVASLLLKQTKDLLIGMGMSACDVDEIKRIVAEDPDILACGRVLTMYIGPHNLLVNLDATFRPELTSAALEAAVDRVEQRIAAAFPDCTRIYVETESQSDEEKRIWEREKL